MFCLLASAQEVSTGGLTYTLDSETLTATLSAFTKAPADSILSISETVTDSTDMKTYTVTAIGEGAFRVRAAYRNEILALRKIVVPKTVTTIGKRAFWITQTKWTQEGSVCSLDSLVFAEGSQLREIGEQAFYMNEVDLPEGLQTIGRGVFNGNDRLTHVGIPSTVDSIAPQAFSGATKLQAVTLPEGLRVVADSAFMNVPLDHPTIPASVERIGALAFSRTSYVKMAGSVPPAIQSNTFLAGGTVEVPLDAIDTYAQADVWKDLNLTGGTFTTDAGRVYTIVGSTTVRLDHFSLSEARVTIPEVETVEYEGRMFTVGDYDFASSHIQELTVERQYKTLPNWTLPSMLHTLRLPASVENIDSLGWTFYNTSRVELFLASPQPPVVSDAAIGKISRLWLDEAFVPAYVGSAWESVPLLNPFSADGFYYSRLFAAEPQVAIEGTSGSSLTISDGMTVAHEGKDYTVKALRGIDDDLRELVVTTTEVSIDRNAVRNALYLESLELPEGWTEIPDQFFYRSNLKHIKLPSTIRTIGQYAFQGTGKLRHVELPEGLKTISFAAFMNTGLEGISLPASVDNIEGRAFSGSLLQRISVAEGSQSYCDVDGVLYSKDRKTLVAWPQAKPQTHYDIPEGTELIASYAFYFPTRLRSLRLPDSFQGVQQLAPRYETDAYNFAVGRGILTVHVNGLAARLDAFTGGAYKTIVYLPAKYTPYLYEPGDYAEPAQGEYTDDDYILDPGEYGRFVQLYGDNALDKYMESIYSAISVLEQSYTVRTEDYQGAGQFEYSFNFNNKRDKNPVGATLEAYTTPGMRTNITIPSELVFTNYDRPSGWYPNGMTDEQRYSWFDGEYWHIPVTGIGDGVFANDDKIETVNLPDGMQYVGPAAFFGCKSLKAVNGVDKMDEAYILADGTYRYTYTGVGNFAFADCPQLQATVLARGSNGIGNASQVVGCTSLKSVELSDSVLALVNPLGCQTAMIDDGVVYVNDLAYRGDKDENGQYRPSNLPVLAIYPAGREATEFVVPDSIQEIGPLSMAYSRVETLTLPASVNFIEFAALYGNSSLKKLVLLADSVQGLPSFWTQENYNRDNSLYTVVGKPYYYSFFYDSFGMMYAQSGPVASEPYPSFDRSYTSQNTVVLMKKAVIEQAEQEGSTLYWQYKQWFKEVRALEDDPVGIETIAGTPAAPAADGWYTLDGRRISRPAAKGLYVHGGRKVVVK